MKIILELDDTISEYEAKEMIESFLDNPCVIDAKIEHCGKCIRNCNNSSDTKKNSDES